MNPDYKAIGYRIRKARLKAGLSQAELAERADASQQHISLVENGRKQVGITVLVHIAEALSVSMDQLLFGVDVSGISIEDKEMSAVLSGCTDIERKVILDIAGAAKRSLAENRESLFR